MEDSEDVSSSPHPSGKPPGHCRSGAPFSALWDQVHRVKGDVEAQHKAIGSLVQYLEGRSKLEEDYARRLESLCMELRQASALSAARGEVGLRAFAFPFDLDTHIYSQ